METTEEPRAKTCSRRRRMIEARELRMMEPLLLTPSECAEILGLSMWRFVEYAPKICAEHGLTPIIVGKVKKYSYAQLREIVARCVKTGRPLYEKD